MDRLTSNEDQNNQRPIHSAHIVEYISPAKMFRFCDNL